MNKAFVSLRRFAREAVTENLRLKSIALVIALLLIILVRFQEEGERLFYVQVVPLLPEYPADLVLVSELPETVRVRLRGARSRINALKEGAIEPVEIDLGGFKPGTSNFFFKDELFEIPSGLEFVGVTPESVSVKMEQVISRWLPVRVKTLGQLKDGTEYVEKPRADPEELAAIGPASIVRELKFIETEDVDIEGLGVGERTMQVIAKRIEGVEIHRGDELKVGVRVRWIAGKRVISGLLVDVEGTELNVSVSPKEVAVSLTGPQVALDRIDLSAIGPYIVLSEEEALKPGTLRREVSVRGLPGDVNVKSIVPAKAQVTLTQPRPAKGKSKGKSKGKKKTGRPS